MFEFLALSIVSFIQVKVRHINKLYTYLPIYYRPISKCFVSRQLITSFTAKIVMGNFVFDLSTYKRKVDRKI